MGLRNIYFQKVQFSSVQLLNRVRLFATPWTTAHQASLSITNSRSPPKPMSSSRWCHPTVSSSVVPFSSCPQSIQVSGSFPMSQLFARGGQSIGVSASSGYSGLISSRVDWLDLLAVQGTLKSLLQHHSSKASILWCSYGVAQSRTWLKQCSSSSFLYSPALASIRDYQKNHSLD